MVLRLPVDPDKTVQADWRGHVHRWHQNVRFYSRKPKYSSFVYYKDDAHTFFTEPYSGYIAMNSAGRKGCESLVLELLNESGC